MRTQMKTLEAKANSELRERWAELWEQSKHHAITTTEAVELLQRCRAFYLSCIDDALERGEPHLVPFFEERIQATAKIIVDIEEELVQADIEIAKTIVRTPLLLAPKEQIDLAHAMGADSLEVGNA